MRRAEFDRIVDTADGNALSQSLELVPGICNASEDLNHLDENSGTILITRQVDQLTNRRTDQVLGFDQVEIVVGTPN